MSISQQILFLISILGACNGILLSGYLFASKKRRSPAAFFLGLLLLALSIRVAKSVFAYFNPELPKICKQIGLSACFLIGPSLYYFLRSVTGNLSVSWKWSLGLQLGLLLLAGIIFPYEVFPHIWNHIFVYVIYAQWLAYLVASGLMLKQEIKALFSRAGSIHNAEKFRLLVFAGNCIIFQAYVIGWTGAFWGLCIAGPVCLSLMLYLTLGTNLYRNGLENPSAAGMPGKRKIPEADAHAWIEKLETAVQHNGLYKSSNLKLGDLARKMNMPAHQLSQLLNDNLGKSFSTFINEYRINEACRLITANSHLTLEAIGYEVGYNSKSTFYTAFRKIKGTTPALYKESMEISKDLKIN